MASIATKGSRSNKMQRWRWIRDWLRTHQHADILDSDFVWAYIEEFNAGASVQFIGAPTCRQLGRDLGAMFKAEYLERSIVGISDGMCHMGFPKWVYSYKLSDIAVLLDD